MSIPEIITIGIVVTAAVAYVIRRAIMAAGGEKGSCKSCSDACGCAISEAMSRQKAEKPKS